MIVKDEAHVIERCLRSVLPLVDWWVVCDTGSSDGTQDVVRRVMGDLPGEVLEHEWVNFGHNRQLALDAARALPHSTPDDVALWIDADEEFVDLPETFERRTEGPAAWLDLPQESDGLALQVRYGELRYHRVSGVRLGRRWEWREPVHEHLSLDGAVLTHLESPQVLVRKEGARSKDPETYRKDTALLEAELRKRPDHARTQFYLAQSLFDAGETERAVELYRRRAANHSGWESERGVALHRLARGLEQLGRSAEEVADAYAAAWDAAPHRAEPLVDLARVERLRGRHHLAQLFAERAVSLPLPASDELFVDDSVYRWRALDEYAVTCSWSGRMREGRRAAEEALAAAPGEERLRQNVEWFRAHE